MNWIQRRIAEARDQGLKELDLSATYWEQSSGTALKELPPEVLDLVDLEKLDLSENLLTSLPREISRLRNLKWLSIVGNGEFEIPSALTELRHLAVLDVRRTKGSAARVLSAMPALRELRVSFEQVADELRDLSRLEHLDKLEVDGVSDLRPGWEALPNLKIVSIYDTVDRTQFERIVGPHPLESLYVTGRDRGVVRAIAKVRGLTSVGLYYCDAFPLELAALPALNELSLFDARLTSFPADLGGFSTLGIFQLDGRDVSLGSLPGSLFELVNLRQLALTDCGLASVEGVSKFAELENLNLSGNGLESVPRELCELERLERLWLYNNRLRTLPPGLGGLKRLKALSLTKNRFEALPSVVFDLKALTRLRCGENSLEKFPDRVLELPLLEELDLGKNQISTIPSSVALLPRLRHLQLDKNPVTDPPPEIVARGIVAIQDYFAALSDEPAERLYEAKLIIVGEGAVGKTWLAHKLVDPAFDFDDERNKAKLASTRGIAIADWHLDQDAAPPFKVHVWDFGGQEIYHATHQFFLTKRSLYVFAWDARKEDRVGGFDYWLNVVGLLSAGSPILIVLNKADERTREIDQASLQRQFPNIVGFHRVSALKGTGMADLREHIQRSILALPHVGDIWPGAWSRVRTALETDPRDYIDYAEYLDVCRGAHLQESQADRLSGYLHDLGVVLHFQDDPLLQKVVILKPDWGTNAVYQVLDTRTIQDRGGHFSFSDLGRIWSSKSYPASKHAELLQLMIRFELCFKLGDSYIAPELLPAQQPAFHWSGERALHFQYHYPFMPAGILTRFIARKHDLIDGDKYWRNGVVLRWQGTSALVVSEPLNRRIRIEVTGADQKSMLGILRGEFDSIHRTLNNPALHEMIPCVCAECAKGDPFLFDHRTMREYVQGGIREAVCLKAGAKRVAVEDLLAGMFEQRMMERGEHDEPRPIVLHATFPSPPVQTPPSPPVAPAPRGPGPSLLVYLFAFVVILGAIAGTAVTVSWWAVPPVLIGTLLALSVIGALQLRQDARLGEKPFVELMKMSLQSVPLLRGSPQKSDPKDEPKP